MQIVFVSGLWTDFNPMWHIIERVFRVHLPDAIFSIEEIRSCQPWEVSRMRKHIDELVEKHRKSDEVVFVAHSFGGLISRAVAQRLTVPVRGIASICTPHVGIGHLYAGILGYGDSDVPLLTFSARRDELVMWGARHPKALAHFELDSNHFTDFVDNLPLAQKIADETVRHFELSRPGT